MKIHLQSDQFDGALHAWCGRGNTAVLIDVFEATPSADRCKICETDWFPRGQPDWHFKAATAKLQRKDT